MALALRLAVIMHRIWVDGTEFRWCRGPLHSFRDRVAFPEVILVSLAERPRISWWHLLHVMTKRNQLSSHIMRRHGGLDTNQALRHVRKPSCNPAAKDLLPQYNRTLHPGQSNAVLTCIDANRSGNFIHLAGHGSSSCS